MTPYQFHPVLVLMLCITAYLMGHAQGLARGVRLTWRRAYEAGRSAYRSEILGAIEGDTGDPGPRPFREGSKNGEA